MLTSNKPLPISVSAQYQQAVEYSPNPIFAVDRQGLIQTWNLACCQLFQYDPTEIIGQPYRILLWKKTDYEPVQFRIERVFKREVFADVSLTFTPKNNRRVLLHARFYPVLDTNGQPALCSIAGTNLTERFELERVRHNRDQQFQTILAASPIGIELFDAQGELLEANPACLKIFGVRDVTELNGFQLFHDPLMPPEIRAKLRSGETVRIEQLLDFDDVTINRLYPTSRTGQIFLDVLVTPIPDPDNIISGYLVQMQDITNYRQTKRQLAEQEQFLFSLNEISRAALGSSDTQGMLETLASRLTDLFRADSCSVTRWDEKAGQTASTTSPASQGEIYKNLRIESDEQTLTASALQAGSPLAIEDVYHTPYLSPHIAQQIPDKSVMAIPLIADDMKLGAAIIGYNTPHKFTEQEIMQARQAARHLSLAVVKADYLAQAQLRYDESELLRRVTAIINSSPDLDETIITILEQLERVIPYDSAAVHVVRDGYMEIIHGRYLSAVSGIGLQFPIPGDTPNTIVVETRQPLLLRHPARTYSSFKQVGAEHIQCWLGVPLIKNDQVIGMISLDGIRPDSFNSDHVRLATALADQIATALEKARLFQEIECHSRNLGQILEVSQWMHRGLQVEQVLEQIVAGILQFGFQIAVLNIYQPETDTLVVKATAGVDEAEQAVLRHAVYEWRDFKKLMQDKFRISHSFFIKHDQFDWEREFKGVITMPASNKYRGPGYWHPRDSLLIPLWDTQGNPLGIISVDEPIDERLPDENTVRILENFANQAAIALENAQLHQQIKKDAVTKTTLLQEVNHRVQNNLSAILGLLSLEKRRWEKTDDPDIHRAILDDMYHRIQGMGAAHKMLSNAEWSPVFLSNLCRQITTAALKILSPDKQITVEVVQSPIRVTAKQATHLALIINELTTNTIKYGMKNRRYGQITVNISLTDDGFIVLEFRDDGPGYPPEVISMEQYDIGIQITQALSNNDLQGELVLKNDNGAVTTIRFKSDLRN